MEKWGTEMEKRELSKKRVSLLAPKPNLNPVLCSNSEESPVRRRPGRLVIVIAVDTAIQRDDIHVAEGKILVKVDARDESTLYPPPTSLCRAWLRLPTPHPRTPQPANE